MKIRLAILSLLAVLSGCANRQVGQLSEPLASAPTSEKVDTTRDGTSVATTLEDYKRDLAQRIVEVNSTKVYVERPQALLRSVIVMKYAVDARGNLVRSEIVRTNHDRTTEATALASLKSTAPFPKPAAHLLHNGRVEISEVWLFNNDGRFQLRTLAKQQMSQ